MRYSPGIGIAVLLIGATVAAHSGALGGTFHYDDAPAVADNPAIRSWQPLFYLTSPLAVSQGADSSGYRPLTVATFAVNYALGGLDPRGYLLVNLLLHLAVSWMVFVVGRRLLGDDRWAAVAALLFAVHPVNAEAVNYVVARSSLLAVAGSLLALWAFLRWLEQGRGRWLGVGLAGFAAALLSKEAATALVVALAAYPWVFEGRGGHSILARRHRAGIGVLAFAALVFVYVGVWWTVAGSGIASQSRAAYPELAFAEIVGRSLLLWVWPWPLGVDHPLTFAHRFDALQAVGFVGLVGAAIGVGAVCRRRIPLLTWGLIWVVAGFLPLLPLPWITTEALLQENRMAFSAVGLAWLSAAGVRAAVERGGRAAPLGPPAWLALAIGAALLVGAIGVDRWRSTVWSDDRRIWEEVVRRAPHDSVAQLNLGVAYRDGEEFERAEAAFRRGQELRPADPRFQYNLGLLALRRQRHDEALLAMERAVALDPSSGTAFRGLGRAHLARGQAEAAMAAFRRAVALNPRDGRAHALLGLAAQRAGDQAAAEAAYREALRFDPHNTSLHNNLGVIAMNREEWPLALDRFTAALRADPGSIEAAYNRAVALWGGGRRDEALEDLAALLGRMPAEPKFEPYRVAAESFLRGQEREALRPPMGVPRGTDEGARP